MVFCDAKNYRQVDIIVIDFIVYNLKHEVFEGEK